jgi:hypothetical protein
VRNDHDGAAGSIPMAVENLRRWTTPPEYLKMVSASVHTDARYVHRNEVRENGREQRCGEKAMGA